jgi:pimeloyl-ACP methyl ester carboxylesterase
LLHGLGASGAVWQAFARRLNPPWRCIAPDLRGHGESEKPASGYEAAEYASDVAALIASLGTEPLPVVGHSLGALVTIALAAHHQDRISAAVLVDPPLDESIARSEVDDVYRLRKAPPGELERYLSVAALAPIFRQAADAAFEAYLRAPRGAKWAWELAPRVSVPTLLVQADTAQGGVLGDRAALDYTTKLPNAERVKVEGAAHAVHATHGAAAAKLVLEFLGRHAS